MREAELIQEQFNDGSFYSERQKDYVDNLLLHQTSIATIYPSNKNISPEDFELKNEIYIYNKKLDKIEKVIFEFYQNQFKDIKRKQKIKIKKSKQHNRLKEDKYLRNIFLIIKYIFNVYTLIIIESIIKIKKKNIITVNAYDSTIFDEAIKNKENEDEHRNFFEKIENFSNEYYSDKGKK